MSITYTWLPWGLEWVYSYWWRACGVPKRSQISVILFCVFVHLVWILERINIFFPRNIVKNRKWKSETLVSWLFERIFPLKPGRSILLRPTANSSPAPGAGRLAVITRRDWIVIFPRSSYCKGRRPKKWRHKASSKPVWRHLTLLGNTHTHT